MEGAFKMTLIDNVDLNKPKKKSHRLLLVLIFLAAISFLILILTGCGFLQGYAQSQRDPVMQEQLRNLTTLTKEIMQEYKESKKFDTEKVIKALDGSLNLANNLANKKEENNMSGSELIGYVAGSAAGGGGLLVLALKLLSNWAIRREKKKTTPTTG